MKNIYFSKDGFIKFFISLTFILLLAFLVGVFFDFELYDYTAFSLIHVFFSFFIIGYLDKMKSLRLEENEITHVIKNPVRIIGKLILVLSIVFYALGWVLLFSSEMTDIWNSSAVLLGVYFFFNNEVIITKKHIYYRDFIIDKSEIIEVKEVNKNKLILKLTNEKTMILGLKDILNFRNDLMPKQ